MLLFELEYADVEELCAHLDRNRKYERLATVHMEYPLYVIKVLAKESKRGNSPSVMLLEQWGENRTVLELYVMLSFMKAYRAMMVLKKHVHPKYHHMIREEADDEHHVVGSADALNQHSTKHTEANSTSTSSRSSAGTNYESAVQPVTDISEEHPTPVPTPEFFKNLTIPQIPYEELEKCTQEWSPATTLGHGGFGTVFEGIWRCTKVAVKRIDRKKMSNGSGGMMEELTILSTYKHDNVVNLYGYSIGGPHHCLVYQLMSGGSLHERLHTTDPSKILQWPTRLDIAIGTARGLKYLHTAKQRPLVHGDIKPANVLLDSEDVPRIGDFGLAREAPEDNRSIINMGQIRGTRAYLPYEFLELGSFSVKIDIYSFGVVLFEIATGLKAYSKERLDRFLRDHVVEFDDDPILLKDGKAPGFDHVFETLVQTGITCTRGCGGRPDMDSVLKSLEAVL